MKKIIPFNNILEFNTDVSEITAISLEHKTNLSVDYVEGTFYIAGEYKVNDGDINKEKFNFELPFDIALGHNYKKDTLIVDIDDFRYELIERKKIKVNIDMYIDGEEELENIRIDEDRSEIIDYIEPSEEELNEPVKFSNIERVTLPKVEEKEEELNINIENNNENINIFNGFNEEEEFVTYKVYRVVEGDTIDNILKKYNVTKEELASYNIIDEIRPGDKLIIPANEK